MNVLNQTHSGQKLGKWLHLLIFWGTGNPIHLITIIRPFQILLSIVIFHFLKIILIITTFVPPKEIPKVCYTLWELITY